MRCKERHELRVYVCVCVGYQAFAFVVGDFDMLSAAFRDSLAFRLLNEIVFLDVS